MIRSPGVQKLLDGVTERLYGMTVARAHELGCCLACGRDVAPAILPDVDRREYGISAICPQCWDRLHPEGDDD